MCLHVHDHESSVASVKHQTKQKYDRNQPKSGMECPHDGSYKPSKSKRNIDFQQPKAGLSSRQEPIGAGYDGGIEPSES